MRVYLSRAKLSVVCAVVAAATLAGVTHAPVAASSSAPAAAMVTMSNTRFGPGTVRVARGGTVTWRNSSEIAHTVTGSGFDSGLVAPGGTYRRTFDKPGSYDYSCTPHRAAGMVGRVIVEAEA